MLGKLKRKINSWQWRAYGKHPCFKDFFDIGSHNAILKALNDWMTKGFATTGREDTALHLNLVSWRFWLQAPGENLIAGIVRDSSDRIGRKFPIMVCGYGPLNSWHQHWNIVSMLCQTSWSQLEQLSSKSHDKLSVFENGMARLTYPVIGGEDLTIREAELTQWMNLIDNGIAQDMGASSLGELLGRDRISLSLVETPLLTPDQLASCWAHAFFSAQAAVPTAVFQGGNQENKRIVFFNRPLNSTDFEYLWNNNSDCI